MNPDASNTPQPKTLSRIDHIYIKDDWTHQINSAKHHQCIHSDHKFVICDLRVTSPQNKGSAYWKLNKQTLTDPKSNKRYKDLIKTINNQNTLIKDPTKTIAISNLPRNWHIYKRRVRALAKQIGREDKERREKDASEAHQIIQILTNKIKLTPYEKNKLRDASQTLKSIEEGQAKAAATRSKMNWEEQSDKPSQFFCNLEKQYKYNLDIPPLQKDETSPLIEDQSGQETLIHQYYSDLYDNKPTKEQSIQELLKVIQDSKQKLTNEQREMLDSPITIKETLEVLKHLPKNKSPGPDGLPEEFYAAYADLMAPILTNLFQDINAEDLSRLGWRESYIRIIYKKGIPSLLKNYRPISLLNADYKIYTKIMANRLRIVIQARNIIHPDQKGFVPNTKILENALRIQMLMDTLQSQGEDAFFLFLDQEKAFDRLDSQFFIRVMEAMNFPPIFMKRITDIYQGAYAKVIVNGKLTNTIHIKCGIRQGDPLSPYLYIIAIEALAIYIREHPEIKGIHIKNSPNNTGKQVVAMVADDTTFFGHTQRELDIITEGIKLFEEASGSKINTDKSELLPIQYSTHPVEYQTEYKILPTNSHTKVIGTLVGKDITPEQIWDKPLTTIQDRKSVV
jgi:hypothetical protein